MNLQCSFSFEAKHSFEPHKVWGFHLFRSSVGFAFLGLSMLAMLLALALPQKDALIAYLVNSPDTLEKHGTGTVSTNGKKI